MIFVKNNDFPKNIPDFPETIPAYLNFGHRHIFFLYPKKLSYSSRNAYVKKIRVRELAHFVDFSQALGSPLDTFRNPQFLNIFEK